MNNPIPAGCLTIQSAALLLGVTDKLLFKKLRELRWLHTGTYDKDPMHNMPRRDYKLAGFVSTHTRGYPAPYNKNIALIYRVPILTERGFNELKIKMNMNQEQPKPAPLTLENAQKKQAQIVAPSKNEEHEKAMAQLREWGFASWVQIKGRATMRQK